MMSKRALRAGAGRVAGLVPGTLLPGRGGRAAPSRVSVADSAPVSLRRWGGGLLLFLVTFWVGFNLRAAILGVPPVLSIVRGALHLSYTEVGLLSGIPILAFGILALPASAMVRRWGGYLVVGFGLALAALGELARVLPWGGAFPLFAGTAVMGVGIALTQPGLPALFQAWFRDHVQRASVTFTLGITVGETVAAGISRPVLYGFLHQWQGTMVVWGACGVSCLLAWVWLVPRARIGLAVGERWNLAPLVRTRALWSVYLCFGGQSLVFFAANTWIPTSAPGGPHSTLANLSLAVLNGVMIPIDVGLLMLRRSFATNRHFYLLSSLITLAGAAGWFLWGDRLPLLFAALIGIGVAMTFAGLLAYAPLVAPAGRVAPLTAVMLSLGYVCAFCGPLLGGLAIDAGGGPRSPFVPIIAASVMMVVASLGVRSGLRWGPGTTEC
ncbi:MAG: MFS transporter [Candidatus Dormibacteria bacterium]